MTDSFYDALNDALNEVPMVNPEHDTCFCGVPVMDCVTGCSPLVPLSLIVPAPRTESYSPSYSAPAAAMSHPEWNTCFCGYPMIHCHCTVAPSETSIIDEALDLANVPPPSPLKRDQACCKLSFDDPIPEILLRAMEAERIHETDFCGRKYLDCNCFAVPCDSNGERIPIQNFCYHCIGNKMECECDPLLADTPVNMGEVKTWVDVYTSVEAHKALCLVGVLHRETYSQTTVPREYIVPEDDWEDVPSDEEPSVEQDAPSAEQDAPQEDAPQEDAPQERGCNDCGYIACSQDCGMRNFD